MDWTLLAILALPTLGSLLGVWLHEGWEREQEQRYRKWGLGDE